MLLLRTLVTTLKPCGALQRGARSKTRLRNARGASSPTAEQVLHNDFTSCFVTAPDGLLLHARIYGSGTASALPVVCLPGLARTAADFHSLATALARDPAEPRRVIAVDYRGHGRSGYDANPENYQLNVDLADLSTVLTTLDVTRAIFIGTSHGGILAMLLARSRPSVIAGVVLNDVGPVIEPRALLQIKGSIGWLPVPRDFTEGGEILRRLFAARFRKLTAQDWIALARRTWREDGRALAPDYDIRLIRRLQGNLEQPPPTLWDAFDALADVPAMIIRGANSAMLTSSTVDSMLARRRELNIVVVPDQGHAPLLEDTSLIGRIAAFTASCDLAQGDRRRPCELLDQHSHGGRAVQPHPRP